MSRPRGARFFLSACAILEGCSLHAPAPTPALPYVAPDPPSLTFRQAATAAMVCGRSYALAHAQAAVTVTELAQAAVAACEPYVDASAVASEHELEAAASDESLPYIEARAEQTKADTARTVSDGVRAVAMDAAIKARTPPTR